MVKSITGLPPTPTTSSYSFHPIYSTPSLHKHDVNSLSYIAPAPATQTYVAPLRQMVTKEQTTSMKSWGFGFTYMFFLLYVLLFTGKTRLQDKENDRRFKKIALFLFFPPKCNFEYDNSFQIGGGFKFAKASSTHSQRHFTCLGNKLPHYGMST